MITAVKASAAVKVDAVGQVSGPELSVKAAGVYVKRTTPIRQICCQPQAQRNQKSDKLSIFKDIDGNVTRLTDPLDTPEILQLPKLVCFLKWLKQSKTGGIYNFLAKYLAGNTDVFAQEVSKLSDPEDYESIFEAVCCRVWQ